MRREVLHGSVSLERCAGYIKVWHTRSARTASEAKLVCEAMDDAMKEWSLNRLLFDSRDADETPKEVGALIWGWMTEHPTLERVATVVHSKELADSVNIRGVGKELRIRSFSASPAAIRWLTLLG